VKTLLKIIGIGLAAFIAVAMVEEWEFFASSWFAADVETAQPVSEEDRLAATEAVYLTLTLMRHFYVSDGDTRFAERMPASDGILDEMRTDIEYLARNHRRQDPELKNLEVTDVGPLDPGRVEVRTRELWHTSFPWIGAEGFYDEPRIEVAYWRYLVVRGASGWRVEGWSRTEPESIAEGGTP
jgi:hypothetical protein